MLRKRKKLGFSNISRGAISCSASSRGERDTSFKKWYLPAAMVSHHQLQHAATSARAPAISRGSAWHARSRRPPRRTAARSIDAGSRLSDTHPRVPVPPPAPAPAPPSLRHIFPSFLGERARCPLFLRSLTAPNWLGPFVWRTSFRSVTPQSQSSTTRQSQTCYSIYLPSAYSMRLGDLRFISP